MTKPKRSALSGQKRTPKGPVDESAMIAALARGETFTKAGALGGVCERTARRRMENPAFRAKVYEARQAMVDRSVGMLADQAVQAVRTLSRLMKSGQPSMEYAAAKAIMDLGPRVREASELAQRLADLEERIEDLKPGRAP
jgi:hypothetical protein